jgi:GDP-L-fucose synthase
MIAIGTSCAYAPEQPLSEDQYLVGQPIASLFTYAMTKRMLRIGLLALEKQYGLRHLTVVPSTLYGPGYHTDGRQMHFIFDLMRKIMRGKLFGDEVVLWGDGYQRRELIYLPDFVALLLRLVDGDHDLVNIGAGEEHSIRDFARLVCQEVGYSFDQIKFDTSRYVGARSKCLDISRLKTLVPDFELTPLQEGLAETVRWFMSKQDVLLAPTRE